MTASFDNYKRLTDKQACIDQAFVKRLFEYNEHDGIFTWRHRTPDTFLHVGPYSTDRVCAAWNAKHAGRQAGRTNGEGYVDIFIHKRPFKAHRLAWLYVHGEWPTAIIDHKDQNRANNCITNLRLATLSQNKVNSSSCSNTSGVRGVHWYKKYGKWVAIIGVNGKQKNLGYFNSIDDAAAARKAAEIRYYGEFAP